MKVLRFSSLMLTVALLGGCVTDQQFLAQNQSAAVDATVSRAKFELNCPDVTTTVLSSKVTQFAYASNRTEYTIGARGCGRQSVYLTYCLNPNNCDALADTARITQ